MARRDYEELLQIFPRHHEARFSLAYVLQVMGKKKDALDQLNQLIELCPDSAIYYASRAGLERELNQYEAALYDWQQAIDRQPTEADYVASQVDLLLLLRRQDEARRSLDAAVRRGIPRGLLNAWYRRLKK